MTDGAVYIAGPMSGRENLNADAFFAAEKMLKEHFSLVLNPVSIGRGIAPDDVIKGSPSLTQTVMEIELMLIPHCAAIYLLRGWEDSVGARGELAVAIKSGCKVIQEGTSL